MSSINEYVDVDVALNTYFPGIQPFDVEAVILDSPLVPIDRRFRVLSINDDLVTDLGDTFAYDFASTYFSQVAYDGSSPDTLVLIRRAKTAIPPMFICGDYETDYAVWELVESGTLTFVDSAATPHTVTVSGIGFGGITAFAQVLTELNAVLAALESPTIVGLDSAEFALDALGRLCLFMPAGQDDTDPTVQISFSATPGTVAYLLGVQTTADTTDGIVPGNAIESYLDAYTAAKPLVQFYNVALEDRIDDTAGDIADAVELAVQIKIDKKQCTFVCTDADAYDTAESGDLHSVLKALANECALVMYYAHTDEYPDAAADGLFLAEPAGAAAYGGRPLSNLVKASGTVGSTYTLTTTQKTGLNTKGCNFIDRVDWIFCHKGKTAAAKEKRMVIAKHWLEANIQASWWAYKATVRAVLFDEMSLGEMGNILNKHLRTLGPVKDGGRGVLSSWTINLPLLSDWTAQNKTENHMPFANCFTAVGTFEGHTFQISGSITL